MILCAKYKCVDSCLYCHVVYRYNNQPLYRRIRTHTASYNTFITCISDNVIHAEQHHTGAKMSNTKLTVNSCDLLTCINGDLLHFRISYICLYSPPGLFLASGWEISCRETRILTVDVGIPAKISEMKTVLALGIGHSEMFELDIFFLNWV